MGGGTRRRLGGSATLRSFARWSGLLFLVAGAVLVALVERAVETEFRGAAEHHAAFVTEAILEPALAGADDSMAMGDGLGSDEAEALATRIRELVLDDTVYHVTVWNSSGDLVAADEASYVGRRAVTLGDGTDTLLAEAAEASVATSTPSPAQYVRDAPSSSTLRTFVGFGTEQRFVAEIHQDWEPTQSAATRFSVRTAVPLVALLGGLWLLLLPVARRVAAELQERSRTDDVTGLPNRRALEERLGSALARLDRRDGPVGVLFIDLDDFKIVNDRRGHEAGDRLLRSVGQALGRRVRAPDILARFASDEFILVLEDTSVELLEQVARRLLHAVRAAAEAVDGAQITASIGIVLTRDPDIDVEDLVRQADAAMFHIKSTGGDGYRIFDDELRDDVARRAWIEEDLPRAGERGELELHFQPFVTLQGPGAGRAVAMEALLRWTHPLHGRVSPGEFIPVAERNGSVISLGAWVVAATCRQAAAWQEELPPGAPFRVFANLSAVQLQPALLHHLDACIAATGVDPSRLGFEVTETAVLEHDDEVVQVLRDIRSRGCLVALDDFGTGYSSLSRLRTLPLDLLKLDASFVTTIEGSGRERAIVDAVSRLSRELGIEVLAEGIETVEQLEAITALGFDLAQGYLLQRPAPAGEVAAWMAPQPASTPAAG